MSSWDSLNSDCASREKEICKKYNRLARGYDDIFTSPINRAEDDIVGNLVSNLVKKKHPRILDLGCGTGMILNYISAKNYKGIDISDKMIGIAKENFPEGKFTIGDMNELIKDERSNSYDLVISLFNSYSYTDNPFKLSREMRRILKKGGKFVAMCYNTRVKNGILISHTTYDSRLSLAYDKYMLNLTFGNFDNLKIYGLNYFGNLMPSLNGRYLRTEFNLMNWAFQDWARHTIIVGEKL